MDTLQSTLDLNLENLYHIPSDEELDIITEEIQAAINKTNQKVVQHLILAKRYKQKISKLKNNLEYFRELRNNELNLANFDTMKKDTLDTLSKLI